MAEDCVAVAEVWVDVCVEVWVVDATMREVMERGNGERYLIERFGIFERISLCVTRPFSLSAFSGKLLYHVVRQRLFWPNKFHESFDGMTTTTTPFEDTSAS